MDKNLKNSLLFGAIVGGLFALGRNAGNKQKVTPGQLKDLNTFKETAVRLQSIAMTNQLLLEVFSLAKEHELDKQYEEVYLKIDKVIQVYQSDLGVVDQFKAALNHILSPRFTAERANAKTHQVQSSFSALSPLPDLVEAIINKRIEILRVVREALGYIANSDSNDFTPDDERRLKSLTDEMKALEARVNGLFDNASLN